MLYLVVVVLCVQSFYTCDVICVFCRVFCVFIWSQTASSYNRNMNMNDWKRYEIMFVFCSRFACLNLFSSVVFSLCLFCSFSLCSLSFVTFCWASFAFFRPQFSVSQLSVSLLHSEQFYGKCIYMSISGPYATFNSLKLKGKYFDWTLF